VVGDVIGRNETRKPRARIRRLRRSELPVDTEELARFLIGKTVVRLTPDGRISGRIVETEAYIVGDAAAHAFIGLTRRNRSLFLKRGHGYVYFAYGSCYLLNVSSEVRGVGAGVLLRALEPLEGVALMQRNRGVTRLRDLARGPGRLAEALDVDLKQDGLDLCATGDLWLGTAPREAGAIGVSLRIGITRDAHRELRFYERGSPFVSGPRSLSP
jgi:DNA-3-methyladenine glycosylase